MLIDLFPLFILAAAEIREPWPPLWFLEWTGQVLLGAWLFALGAAVGSFLNVVVYRLPRGMSLNHPASHCPKCGHAIRWRDNLPIIGWLVLGGKCRDCQNPISPRYFLVELVVATVFLLAFLCEAIWPRGWQVPPALFSGRALLTPEDALPFWFAYATHVLLATTLIGATLIDWDGFRTQRRLFWPILLVGLVLPLVWPEIRRIPAYPALSDTPAWRAGLIDGVAGLAAGLALGLAVGAAWWLGSRGRGWPKFAPAMLLVAVGAVVGWQRLMEVAPAISFFLLVALAVQCFTWSRWVFPPAAPLLLALSPKLVEWDWDAHHTAQLGAGHDSYLFSILLSVTTIVFAFLAGVLARSQYFDSPALDRPREFTTQPQTPAQEPFADDESNRNSA